MLTPTIVNVDAGLRGRLRSGEHVRWVPEEVGALMRLLAREGAAHADAAELAQIVHSESRAHAVDPLYTLALMKIESNFRADVVSPHGAIGLLQIRPQAARCVAAARGRVITDAHATRLRDPRTNVAVGLGYLRHLERQFPDRAMALAAYNLGPSRVRRRLERGTPVPREYADRVLAAYRDLASARSGAPVEPASGG